MASQSRVDSRLILRRDPDTKSALRALGLYGGGHHALGIAFTRRRPEGAGGFFGIEGMSRGRIISVGGVIMATRYRPQRRGRKPHSDKLDFPNWINGPKTADLSEWTLKSLGDQHPSKLMTRVRFPSPAPFLAGL
jgi:hypothetical protein